MKPRKTYLKGKFVFITSLIVVLLSVLLVYITGINFNRSLSDNFYISLSIISTCLFIFLVYGLFKGIGLLDDNQEIDKYEPGRIFNYIHSGPGWSGFDFADDIGGAILSILLWIAVAFAMVLLLLIIEALFWLSLLLIFTMLYWVFIRAFKLVFSKSRYTKGSMPASVSYALFYTLLYTGWIFAVVYATDLMS